jgi:hypothetical protein
VQFHSPHPLDNGSSYFRWRGTLASTHPSRRAFTHPANPYQNPIKLGLTNPDGSAWLKKLALYSHPTTRVSRCHSLYPVTWSHIHGGIQKWQPLFTWVPQLMFFLSPCFMLLRWCHPFLFLKNKKCFFDHLATMAYTSMSRRRATVMAPPSPVPGKARRSTTCCSRHTGSHCARALKDQRTTSSNHRQRWQS